MPTSKGEFLTTGGRVRSFLGWAFVISLVIHFLAAPFLKTMSQTSEEQQVEKVAVTKKIKIKVPTPPPPTPPPKQQVQPKQQTNPQPQLKLNVQHVQSKSNTGQSSRTYVAPKAGSEQGVPQGTQGSPGPAPGPVQTAKPACGVPYQDAHVVQEVTPDYPESARELGLGEVTVQVEVTLSPSGSLIGEKIYSSAGNMSLDQAALSAARQSTYAPKIVNCQPTQGDYLFKVTFDPNS